MMPRRLTRRYRPLGLMLLLVCLLPAGAAANILYLQPELGEHDPRAFISVLPDPKEEFILSDLIDLNPRDGMLPATDTDYPSFGFVDGAFWSRLQVHNPRDTTIVWYLSVENARMQHLQLHIVREDGAVESRRSGSFYPFAERELDYRFPTFGIPVESGETLTLFLRSQTRHSHALPLIIRSEEHMAQALTFDSIGLGVFYGMLILLLIINVDVLLVYRGRPYLYYTAYLCGVWLLTFTIDGLAFQYLWPELPDWNSRAVQWITPFVLGMASAFAMQVLEIRRIAPRLYRCMQGLLIYVGLCFVHAVFGEQSLTRLLLLGGGVATFAGLSAAAIASLRAEVPAARLYMLAWLAILATMLLWVTSLFGLVANQGLLNFLIRGAEVIQFLFLAVATFISITTTKREYAASLREQLATRRQLVELGDASQRFVPHSSLQLLKKTGVVDIRLGEHLEGEMSALYIDIRSFTSLTERMSARQNFDFLNTYFTTTAPIIRGNRGFVCRYIGDAMLCLFPESADDAVTAALELLAAVEQLNQQGAMQGLPQLSVGIGIHTGNVRLGILGDEQRMEISPLGPTLHIAQALEGRSKGSRALIIISSTTYAALSPEVAYGTRKLLEVVHASDGTEIDAFEAFDINDGTAGLSKLGTKQLFEEAVTAYQYHNLPKCITMLEQVLAHDPSDAVAQAYLEKCRQFLEDTKRTRIGATG